MLEAFKAFIENELEPRDEIPVEAKMDQEFWILFKDTGKFYGDLPYGRLEEWLNTTTSGNRKEFEDYIVSTGKSRDVFYKKGDEGI